MTLPTNEFYRVSLNFTGGPVTLGAAVVFAVRNSTAFTPTGVGLAVVDAINTSGIMANLSANLDITSILVKQGPDDSGASALVASAIPGTKAGLTSPANVSFLMHKITAAGGRRGRGRSFWPGVSESDVDEQGTILAATVTAFQTDVDALLTALSVETIPMYLEHAPPTSWVLVDGQPRRVATGPAPAPTEVTDVVIDPRAATQRRRLRR